MNKDRLIVKLTIFYKNAGEWILYKENMPTFQNIKDKPDAVRPIIFDPPIKTEEIKFVVRP